MNPHYTHFAIKPKQTTATPIPEALADHPQQPQRELGDRPSRSTKRAGRTLGAELSPTLEQIQRFAQTISQHHPRDASDNAEQEGG